MLQHMCGDVAHNCDRVNHTHEPASALPNGEADRQEISCGIYKDAAQHLLVRKETIANRQSVSRETANIVRDRQKYFA